MRKIIIILGLFACTLAAGAQGSFNPAKFRAELHQHITKEAQLTSAEAEKFFPLYDEMKEKQRNLHRQMRDFVRQKPATEAACRCAIVNKDKLEVQMKEIERTYHVKFLKVVSASKLYDILKAEDKFHKQAFRKAAKKDR